MGQNGDVLGKRLTDYQPVKRVIVDFWEISQQVQM